MNVFVVIANGGWIEKIYAIYMDRDTAFEVVDTLNEKDDGHIYRAEEWTVL